MSLGSVRWLGILGLFVGPGRDWIGVPWTVGLVGGFSCGRFVGLTPFLWGHGVSPPIFSLPFSFLSVIGGSGVLSHGAVFGLCFLFFSIFFFLWTLGLFSEH